MYRADRRNRGRIARARSFVKGVIMRIKSKRFWAIGLLIVMGIGLWGCGDRALPFHAEIIGNGTVSDWAIVPQSLGYFTDSFWKDNTIGGVEYLIETSEEVFYDDVSPTYRLHIVTDQELYDSIFIEAREIDFENTMLLVYMCGTINNRLSVINSIKYQDKILSVNFTQEKGKPGYKDTCAPKRRFLVLKMDKLDIEEVVFVETK